MTLSETCSWEETQDETPEETECDTNTNLDRYTTEIMNQTSYEIIVK